ncbi:MAG: hypothetical protein ABSB87_09460 [Terriglobales bacterium]|jgi:hypothetical protein
MLHRRDVVAAHDGVPKPLDVSANFPLIGTKGAATDGNKPSRDLALFVHRNISIRSAHPILYLSHWSINGDFILQQTSYFK